jgi:hypothetical protein
MSRGEPLDWGNYAFEAGFVGFGGRVCYSFLARSILMTRDIALIGGGSMHTENSSWRIVEDFLAEQSAFLHGFWNGSSRGTLPVLHGLEVLPGSVLIDAPENWMNPDPASVPTASRDWAGGQKMRYPAALRSIGSMEIMRQVGNECLDDGGSFSFGTLLVAQPWSLRVGHAHYFVSVGLRLDATAFEPWLRAAILSDE